MSAPVRLHEPVCFDNMGNQFYWIDHFLGDQIKDEWRVLGNGTGVVVDQQTGGIIRLTTGAVTTNAIQLDWVTIRSLHVDKRVAIEWRVKLNQTNAMFNYFGLRFDFSNSITFWYETAIGHTRWYPTARDGGATTRVDSGITVDTDYHIFRILCELAGGSHAHFYIDGIQTANSPITTNIPDDATDFLMPWIYLRTQEDVAKSKDVDYVVVRQDI